MRAVLGYCAGTAMATRLADAIAATGPPPMVVLFDAVSTTGGSLASQFTSALESNARHLTADELADARALSEQLVATYPDDLPRIAAALTDRYDRLIRAVADRLSVHEFLRQELTGAFTAYLDYLLLASEGGFDMRTTTPLFLCSAGYEPPVEGARTIVLDIGHDDLLRAPRRARARRRSADRRASVVTLPEISEVLSAHPGVRRAETAIVRHDGRDVAIAAVELSGYVSGPDPAQPRAARAGRGQRTGRRADRGAHADGGRRGGRRVPRLGRGRGPVHPVRGSAR